MSANARLGRVARVATLAAINLALVGAVAFVWQRGERLIAAVDTLPLTRTPIPDLALAMPEPRLGIYPVIQSQALFHRSRTFYVPPPPDAAPVLPAIPDYVFAGAMTPPGGKAVAALKDPQTGSLTRVRVGDTLSSWSVRIVDARRVVVEHSGTQREFAATTAASGPAAGGLQRVGLAAPRPTLAPGEVRTLGSGSAGSRPAAVASVVDNSPRLYRPPPPP
jgi:hypothetical protein